MAFKMVGYIAIEAQFFTSISARQDNIKYPVDKFIFK